MRQKPLNPEEFLQAFDAGQEVNERTLLDYACGATILEEGSDRRWSRTMVGVVEIGGRYFQITWEHGLTEYQDDYCYDQPIEVRKVVYDKVIPEHTVQVTEYIKLNSSSETVV